MSAAEGCAVVFGGGGGGGGGNDDCDSGSDGGRDNSGGEFGDCVDGGYYGAGRDSSGRTGIINRVKLLYLLRSSSKNAILYVVSTG